MSTDGPQPFVHPSTFGGSDGRLDLGKAHDYACNLDMKVPAIGCKVDPSRWRLVDPVGCPCQEWAAGFPACGLADAGLRGWIVTTLVANYVTVPYNAILFGGPAADYFIAFIWRFQRHGSG